MKGLWQRARQALAARIDCGSLVAFRVLFGAIAALQAWSLLRPDPDQSWIERNISGPHVEWTLPFPGFDWIRPLPVPWMEVVAWVAVVAASALALGLASRFSAALLCLAWTYLWTCDATQFNNHYYFTSLVALLLATMPAGRWFGLGRLWRRRREEAPPEDAGLVPRWTVFVLRAQVFILYLGGGLTKLNGDYLLRAEPVRTFLSSAAKSPRPESWLPFDLASQLLPYLTDERFIFGVAYAGLLYDLLIPFLLLWRRTLPLAFLATVAFHGLNHSVFFTDIGWFPLLAIAATTIFFPAAWPSRLWVWLKRPRWRRPDWRWFVPGLLLLPPLGAALGWKAGATERRPSPSPLPALGTGLLVAWLALQVLLPLRSYAIPGDVTWTTEGLLFSWRMKFSVRTTDLHAITVVDDELTEPDPEGGDRMRWDRWDGPRMIYRHVPATEPQWESLPQLLVVREPVVGDRLIVNLSSGGAASAPGLDEARSGVSDFWSKQWQRQPSLHETLALEDILGIAALQARGQDPARLDALKSCFARASRLAEGGLDESALYRTVELLRREILALDDAGGALRSALRRAPPLALAGAPRSTASFLVVEDPLLLLSQGGSTTLDPNAWRAATGEALVVHADLRRLSAAEWRVLPRELPVEDPEGRIAIWWNLRRDLNSYTRQQWILAYPLAMQQYARRIANEWEIEQGRRPQVHVRTYLNVNHTAPRLLIDPAVDLAAEPVLRFGHNRWILPADDYPPLARLPLTY